MYHNVYRYLMDCRDCHRWDSEAKKCLDGKVNPHNWEVAVTVVQVLGLRAVCPFNDYRERLIGCRLGPKVREMIEKRAE